MQHTLAYYITPHGFGHAVRSLEVIRQLLASHENLDILVVTDLPQFLLDENVGRPLPQRRKRVDVGLVQKDSLQFDLEATRSSLEDLYGRRHSIVEEEIRFFREKRVQAIVCDIPFLPFEAAALYGIPALGMSNFTWDWIYQAYAQRDGRWHALVDWIRQSYEKCAHFLQLPMHGDCSACPRRQDVPLVARKVRRSRQETRRVLGCDEEQKAYLVAFADLRLDDTAQRRLEAMSETLFFYKKPLSFEFSNGRSLDAFSLPYTDVVAAMDGVITKPGYGIVSDCLVAGAPMVYTDRGFFPEYEILVQEMKRQLATVYLPSADLYVGEWEAALRNLEVLPVRHVRVDDDGAAVCAEVIWKVLGGANG